MKRIFKILLVLVLAVIITLILAAVLMPMIYDKEDLKKTIASEVQKQTGRELSIDGALDFSVFPWLAVEVSDLSLSNVEGFGDQPFARIGQARVGVALIPLFRKKVTVDHITLDGLELALAVNARGQNNWDDLADGVDTDVAPADEDGGSVFSSKRVAGLSIRDARIEYQDQQAGEHYRLSDFSMRTGALGDGDPVPLSLSMLLEDLVADTRAVVELAATVAIDLAAEQYTLDDFELALTLEAADAPAGAQTIHIRAPRVRADLAAQTLQMDSFTAELASLDVEGALFARNILDAPAYEGSLSIADFSPAGLMEELQMEPLVTADPAALQHARLSSSFTGDSAQIKLSDFELELDQSHFAGEMAVQNFAQPRINFDFAVNEIDLNRYLEPAPDSAASSDVVMPREELQGQDVKGMLRIGKLRLMGLDLSDAEIGIRVRNGTLRLNPLTAGFYGGAYSGDIMIDSSGAVPTLSLDEKIDSISFQQLAANFVDTASLSGLAQGHVRLTGRGATSDEVLRSLNGDLGLTLTDGALEGINIWYEIRRGLAMYKGLSPPSPESNRTVFSRMQLSGDVQGGVFQTRELIGELPFVTVSGSGTIDLAQSSVDLGLVASVRNVPELANDPLAADLKGKSLPFRVSGALDDPSVAVDWEALLKSEATGILLDKLGLGTQETAEDGADGEREEKSTEDQTKDAVMDSLFDMMRGKDKKKDKNDDG